MSSIARLRARRGTATTWTASNPVLGLGEFGIETDTRRLKVGDGATAWISLPYFLEGAQVRGQASRMTSGTISIATAGTYQTTGLSATFDSATAYGISLATTNLFGLKNTSGATRLCMVQASMDASAGNNHILGIKLAKNGVAIDQSECRAFSGSNTQIAKLFCFWMVELSANDEVSMFATNHTDTTPLSFQRGRISAVEVRS